MFSKRKKKQQNSHLDREPSLQGKNTHSETSSNPKYSSTTCFHLFRMSPPLWQLLSRHPPAQVTCFPSKRSQKPPSRRLWVDWRPQRGRLDKARFQSSTATNGKKKKNLFLVGRSSWTKKKQLVLEGKSSCWLSETFLISWLISFFNMFFRWKKSAYSAVTKPVENGIFWRYQLVQLVCRISCFNNNSRCFGN